MVAVPHGQGQPGDDGAVRQRRRQRRRAAAHRDRRLLERVRRVHRGVRLPRPVASGTSAPSPGSPSRRSRWPSSTRCASSTTPSRRRPSRPRTRRPPTRRCSRRPRAWTRPPRPCSAAPSARPVASPAGARAASRRCIKVMNEARMALIELGSRLEAAGRAGPLATDLHRPGQRARRPRPRRDHAAADHPPARDRLERPEGPRGPDLPRRLQADPADLRACRARARPAQSGRRSAPCSTVPPPRRVSSRVGRASCSAPMRSASSSRARSSSPRRPTRPGRRCSWSPRRSSSTPARWARTR